MTVIMMIAIPAALIAAVYFAIIGLMKFGRDVQAKFGCRFFRVWKFMAIVFGALLLAFGKWVEVITLDMPTYGTNGIVLMLLGVLLLGLVVSWNYRKTDALYDTAGTVIEIAISPFTLLLGLFFVVILLFCGAGEMIAATPVRVINE